MKSVLFTLTITGKVPDDVDIDSLFLDLNLKDVQVGRFVKGEPRNILATLGEYETVSTQSLDDDASEWCENNNCERRECHRCFPVSGCQEHHKCSKMTWESA